MGGPLQDYTNLNRIMDTNRSCWPIWMKGVLWWSMAKPQEMCFMPTSTGSATVWPPQRSHPRRRSLRFRKSMRTFSRSGTAIWRLIRGRLSSQFIPQGQGENTTMYPFQHSFSHNVESADITKAFLPDDKRTRSNGGRNQIEKYLDDTFSGPASG